MNLKRLICILLAFMMSAAPLFFGTKIYAASNEELVYNFLKTELKFNDAQACGILASIYGESRFIPTASCIDVDGLPSYGLCQWHAGRLDELKDYCSSNGLDYTTVNGQMSFLKYELFNTEQRAYAQMLGIPNTADGAYTAGYNWSKYYERGYASLYESRANIAKTMFWPKYGGSPDEPLYSTIAEGTYYLKNNSNGKYMTVPSHQQNNGADVAVGKLTLDDYFKIYIKKSLAGYLLKPVFTTGPVVNIYATIVQSGKNVTLYEPTGNMSQEWYFDVAEGGYVIRSVQMPECVMDLSGDSVKVMTYTGSSSQTWTLVPTALPAAVTPTVNAGKSGEITTVSWTAADFADSYDITVYDKGRNKNVVSTTVSSTEYSAILQDGTYTVRIDALNSPLKEAGNYKTTGNTVSFTVEKLHEHSFTGRRETVSEATCTSTGTEKIFCSDPQCGEYITSQIPMKEHTYSIILTPATTETEGKIEKRCSVCGNTYTETVLSIPTPADPLISVSDISTLPGKTFDAAVTFSNPSGTRYASFNLNFDSASVQLLEITSQDPSVTDLSQEGNTVRFEIADPNAASVVITCKLYIRSDASGESDVSISYSLMSFSAADGSYIYPALDSGKIRVVDSVILYGDADSNGDVNFKDVLLIRRFIAGAENDDALNFTLADVDGDENVNAKDVLYIRRFISGVINNFPVQNN